LYILLALVLTGMVNYTRLNVGDPLAFAFGPEGADISWIAGIIAVSAVIALATVFLVFQIGQPRLWMAMSRDGLLPKVFSSIHPRFRTPWFSTIITGLVVAIPALFMNLTEVTDLAVIGTLFAFFIVCAGVLVKDEEFRSEKRFVPYINSQFILPVILLFVLFGIYYFNPNFISDFFTVTPEGGESWSTAFSHKIPMIVFVIMTLALVILTLFKKLSLIPILGLLSTGYLMTELGITNWTRFGIWLAVGLKIYRLYGYRNSHLHSAEQTANGIGVLSVASVLADILLLSLIVFPLVESLLGFTISFIVNLILAVVVAVLLEIVTQYFQGKK
ncbi:MAG TPA: amino acid permease C-terminal domain-containing protein, partial [Pyrinomonadaceae bacterium]|nr:amino acid permease C-terminal domain-containing protein [Pyrinomonadaceae bacterium]